MSSNVLADKDINTSAPEAGAVKTDGKTDVKSMDYHRQVLQSKLDQGQYVPPNPIFLL